MLRLLELEGRAVPHAPIPVESLPWVSTFVGPDLLDNTVPQLASLPGAKHTIFLDFDGHVTGVSTGNPSWFNQNQGIASIVTPPFDVDGNALSFSSDERDRIRATWEIVAEDFAPFNVNVTTVQPPENDLFRGDGDDKWGIRVCMGGSYTDWWNIPNGGVAHFNSFNYTDKQTPAYAFTLTLQNNPKFMGEAASHEVGHTFTSPLFHDGRTSPSEAYYLGHGSGEIGWAPIMGAGYYQPLTQWSKGEYPNANNFQDDLAIIAGEGNGFGYRPDDYVTPFAVNLNQAVNGIIERTDDVDIFKFTAVWNGDKPAAKRVPITISVIPSSPFTNLDVRVRIYDSSGTLLADHDDPVHLASTFVVPLRVGGEYYAHVEGTGNSNSPKYASLGRYRLEVTNP